MLLDDVELQKELADLPCWTFDDGVIRRSYELVDFAQAFLFMTKVASLAEQQHHHPDWNNSYKRVNIALTTHELAGVSSKDIALAHSIDQIVM